MKKELRSRSVGRFDVRGSGAAGGRTVEGYVTEFGKLSGDLGGFREMVERGAFERSVREGKVVALWQHKQDDPIGRQSNGLLDLREDDTGLWFSIKREAFSDRQFEKIADGTVRNMSFGFYTRSDRWEKRGTARIRILEDVDLLEVSPVTFPAYQDSSAAVRSMRAWEARLGALGPARQLEALERELKRAELDVRRRDLDLGNARSRVWELQNRIERLRAGS